VSFSNPETTAPLSVGGFELEIGASAGTRASPLPGVASSAEPDLSRALDELDEETADEETTLGMAVTESVDEAAEITSQVERATEIFEMLARDRTLDPMQFRGEIDSLLDRLAEHDRSGRLAEALRLARALEKLLALIKRWEALGQTLTTAYRAAHGLGNQRAVAWVRHELGTLQLAAGDPVAADRNLSAARTLREQLGDRAGLRVTDGNLQSLCHELRQQVRDGRLRPPEGRQPGPVPVALLVAGAMLLLLAGGVAGAVISDDGGSPVVTDVAETTGTSTTGPAGGHQLEVEAGAGGSVRSNRGGIVCPPGPCSARFADDTDVTLNAIANPGFEFERWGGACEGEAGLACNLTLGSDLPATATFVETESATATLTVTVTSANLSVGSDPEGFACVKQCSRPFRLGSTVTLIANRTGEPPPEDPFDWGGECEGTPGDTSTCPVLLDADKSVSVGYSTPELR
jgi:Divergent InlB B-repeat domain